MWLVGLRDCGMSEGLAQVLVAALTCLVLEKSRKREWRLPSDYKNSETLHAVLSADLGGWGRSLSFLRGPSSKVELPPNGNLPEPGHRATTQKCFYRS